MKNSSPVATPRPAQKKTGKESLSEDKVLVIEDSADQWSIIQKAFQQVNPQTQPILATNRSGVVALLQEYILSEARFPQVILLDLYLPKRQDGWNVLEAIQRLLPPSKKIPVFILSSSRDLEDVIDAYQQGIQSYIIKPKTFPEWLECCKVVCDYIQGLKKDGLAL
jgi:CheY-like chemotaxis protein